MALARGEVMRLKPRLPDPPAPGERPPPIALRGQAWNVLEGAGVAPLQGMATGYWAWDGR